MKKGFSLIELMVVIAIIAILAAIALPLYAEFTCKAQAQEALNAVKDTKAAIAAARTQGQFNEILTDNSEQGLVNDFMMELPTQNWNYAPTPSANTITFVITTDNTSKLKQCVKTMGTYTIQADYANNGIEFRVTTSGNQKYVKTANY